MDLISLMPDLGFIDAVEEGKSVQELVNVSWNCGAITIGSHVFTLWDPWCVGKIPFRLADEDERKRIFDEFCTDRVDCVASNAFWMRESNELVKKRYIHPLWTSDTHSKTKRMRMEIGRAGTIFKRDIFNYNLREALDTEILFSYYKTYEGYMPALQFVRSIAL